MLPSSGRLLSPNSSSSSWLSFGNRSIQGKIHVVTPYRQAILPFASLKFDWSSSSNHRDQAQYLQELYRFNPPYLHPQLPENAVRGVEPIRLMNQFGQVVNLVEESADPGETDTSETLPIWNWNPMVTKTVSLQFQWWAGTAGWCTWFDNLCLRSETNAHLGFGLQFIWPSMQLFPVAEKLVSWRYSIVTVWFSPMRASICKLYTN